MSYTKYTWETGEVITAAKLNNMEDGIDDKLIVSMLNAVTGELDASYADLLAAWTAKKNIVLYMEIEGVKMIAPFGSLWTQNDKYFAEFIYYNDADNEVQGFPFSALSEDAHMVERAV